MTLPHNPLARALSSLRLRVTDPAAYRLIRAVRTEKLTYLGEHALSDLHRAVERLEQRNLPGSIIEAGVALGGSAVVLAKAKTPNRPLYLYDVFGMIPPPTDLDGQDAHARYAEIKGGRSAGIKGNRYYGYEDGLLEKVKGNLSRFGVDLARSHVELVPGLFEETLRIDGPVALAHIDCDWYQSVMVCLEHIAPHLVPGGVLVIDDYRDWSGCKRAVDEYFAGRDAQFQFTMHSRLHVERRA